VSLDTNETCLSRSESENLKLSAKLTYPKLTYWIAALFVIGVIFRFLHLDVRPVHHDESLHAMYSKYIVDDQVYKYDPMLHGPLLYRVTSWIFSLFGLTTFALRSLNAGLGSLCVLSPLLFRRFLSDRAIIAASAFIAISPTLVYWSRFAHHDYLVIASYLLLAAGVLNLSRGGGIILACLSFALQYTIKANVFVFAALLAGYLIFEFIVSRSRKEGSLLGALRAHLRSNTAELFLGIAVSALVFCALYSSDFRNTEGILDGLYRKVFPYWLNQHHIQRLDGPFTFHLLVICLYELPLLLFSIVAVALTVRDFKPRFKVISGAISLLLLISAFFVPQEQFVSGFFKQHLKLAGWFDLWVSGSVALLAVLVPLHHRQRSEQGLAFFGYLALAMFWVYGFLGEKVPWLSIYPTITLFAYTVLRLDRALDMKNWLASELGAAKLLRITSGVVLMTLMICIGDALLRGDEDPLPYSAFLLTGWSIAGLMIFGALEFLGIQPRCRVGAFLAVLSGLVLVRSTIVTNYTAAGAPSELLSQVHTTEQMHRIFLSMRSELMDPLHPGEIEVLVSGASVWPATWYFIDQQGFHFTIPESEYPAMAYIVADEKTPNLPEEMESERVPLQSWWVPNYKNLKLRDLLGYFFTHQPWNQTGSLYVRFLRAGYGLTTESEPS